MPTTATTPTPTPSSTCTSVTPHDASSTGAINGIDVVGLQASIDAIKADAGRGQTKWSIHSRWKGGARSDHHIRGFEIGGLFVQRPFVINVDEPLELAGTNEFANPQEYLLSAMNACMMVGYAAVAALMGIELTKLEIETSGSIDLRGFLGISDRVPAGYEELQQTVHIAGNASAEQFAELHETVRSTSPNFFNITHAIPTHTRMVVE